MELGNLIFGNSRGKYPVIREWQNMFVGKLNEMGFDGYGNAITPQTKKLLKCLTSQNENKYIFYENDTFILMPYYWGDDDEIAELPNFVFKPTGFELCWYKYALRDSYMNQNITKEELINILDQCIESIKK